MSGIAFHFSGGDAYFSGAAFLVAACIIAILRRKNAASRWERLLGLTGVCFITLSATPLPWWLYAGWAAFGAVWWQSRRPAGTIPLPRRMKFATWSSMLLLLVTLLVAGYELTFRFSIARQLQGDSHPSVAIIGDSISAGMLGPKEQTWPKKFEETYHIQVIDVSAEGATARSALKQAEKIPDDASLVVIEIGGNDILGPTTADAFAKDLENLLQRLRRPGRRLIMLELPLPPFYNAFGRSQRILANRYDVALISKRDFAKVLATDGATLDGLHLSRKGHRLMADMIWNELGNALHSQRAEK